MRKTSIVGRLDDLEAARGPRVNRALLRQIAVDEETTEAELLAEIAEMTAICRAQGIFSEAAMVRYWADALGITQAELDAWSDRYQAWL